MSNEEQHGFFTKPVLGDVQSLTKQEAIKLMQEGKRITHRYFSADEWMTMNNKGYILLEDGVQCSLSEFFRWRTDETWNDGYSLHIA
jgi:hypothetical protein